VRGSNASALLSDAAVKVEQADEKWEWAQSLDVRQLSNFDAEAAEISANTNGFYLFHSAD
jgi:hypothetical protein